MFGALDLVLGDRLERQQVACLSFDVIGSYVRGIRELIRAYEARRNPCHFIKASPYPRRGQREEIAHAVSSWSSSSNRSAARSPKEPSKPREPPRSVKGVSSRSDGLISALLATTSTILSSHHVCSVVNSTPACCWRCSHASKRSCTTQAKGWSSSSRPSSKRMSEISSVTPCRTPGLLVARPSVSYACHSTSAVQTCGGRLMRSASSLSPA